MELGLLPRWTRVGSAVDSTAQVFAVSCALPNVTSRLKHTVFAWIHPSYCSAWRGGFSHSPTIRGGHVARYVHCFCACPTAFLCFRWSTGSPEAVWLSNMNGLDSLQGHYWVVSGPMNAWLTWCGRNDKEFRAEFPSGSSRLPETDQDDLGVLVSFARHVGLRLICEGGENETRNG